MDDIRKVANLDLSGVTIAVDFDGTCVMHEFPDIGKDVPYAVDVLKALSSAGARLILWTMRSDKQSAIIGSPTETDAAYFLQHAVNWFAAKEIPLFGANANPEQVSWTDSPKAYAQIYIDDAALGCPLREIGHSRPYVDWLRVAEWFTGTYE